MPRPMILSLVFLCLAPNAFADEPLHMRIDAAIAGGTRETLAPVADDAEFLRRVYLDLIGRIPSTQEAREFCDSTSPDKRTLTIDRLLDSPEHPQRLRDLFHVMLMERLGDHDEWDGYLLEAFRANRHWDQVTQELLHPDAENSATRGSAFFLSKRLEKYGQNPTDYPGLVRDVGRMFLGIDVQCAQCHDHLFVDEYKQVDYQGLFAFVGQTVLRSDVTFPSVAENVLAKPVTFKSVFGTDEMETGPRLPGKPSLEIPTFAKGEEYRLPPDKKTKFPGVPKFSPLEELAKQITEHPSFRRNIANRLWWVMMGRGLVEPLDLHHADNPATHPELLALLGDELAEHHYDLRFLLRELALTRTYQRSSVQPRSDAPLSEAKYEIASMKPLSPEQWSASITQALDPATVDMASSDEADLKKKRKELTARFVASFANPPREPEIGHRPSVKGALFVLNDDAIVARLAPANGNLVDRLMKANDATAAAQEAYWSVLTRSPAADEITEFQDYLAKHESDRSTAMGHLVWALLASTEFSVNH